MKQSFIGNILKNHSLAMILCCAIPFALIVILSITGSLGSWGFYAIILLCPVLHIVMMRGHGSSAHDAKRLIQSSDVAEDQQRINENHYETERKI